MKIKRYRFDEVYNSGKGAVEDPNGDWVKYSDIENITLIHGIIPECNCTKCESARAGHYVKGIDDYYME